MTVGVTGTAPFLPRAAVNLKSNSQCCSWALHQSEKSDQGRCRSRKSCSVPRAHVLNTDSSSSRHHESPSSSSSAPTVIRARWTTIVSPASRFPKDEPCFNAFPPSRDSGGWGPLERALGAALGAGRMFCCAGMEGCSFRGGIGAWDARRILQWFELGNLGGCGRSHDADPRQCPTSALGAVCQDPPQLFHPNRGAETAELPWERKIPRETRGLTPACVSTNLGH